MMILLSQREYNDLVSKASNIEAQVELRVEQEKSLIKAALVKSFSFEATTTYARMFEHDPIRYIRDTINKILS